MATQKAVETRVDRRKARTRQALIGAAQRFLAERRVAVSIQDITDAADVGFGTFYNHFETKDELFEAAVLDALRAYAEMRDVIVADIEDAAEAFTVSLRMTGRLQRQVPELVRVVLHTGTAILVRDDGLAPRARADLNRAMESGRFDAMDSDLALMAAGGALLGLLQLLDSQPEADAGVLSDELALRLLRMFGMPKAAATKLATAPLPDLPDVFGLV